MDKNAFQEKALRHEAAAIAKLRTLSDEATQKAEANRITAPDSLYRPFELIFGADILREINNFLFSLAKSEFAVISKDPLLLICQKLMDWKGEVGSDRLWHELFRSSGSYDIEISQSSKDIIHPAWEQVKKEQSIIEAARQAYKARLKKMVEDNPNMPNEDPAQWCSLCDGFSEFEALQEFGYPLPFDTVFGTNTPKDFNYEVVKKIIANHGNKQ